MMMSSLEQATEPKAPAPARRGSITKLTTASSSFVNLLSVFLGASSTDPRPRRSFDAGGVGLGIVAAMSSASACLTEAEPIAIGAAARRRALEAELSESYTCVITHLTGVDGTGGSVRKRVYFGFGGDGSGWLVEADEGAPAADFLSRCCLCDKRLDGLDIYMYRGEKAFCSSECRCHQMLMDDHADHCGSETLKANNYSASPHSAPLAFSLSVAAA